MNRPETLAEQVIDALSAIKGMSAHTDHPLPERHAVRDIKRIAEQTLADACRTVIGLSYTVTHITDAINEAKGSGAQGEAQEVKP